MCQVFLNILLYNFFMVKINERLKQERIAKGYTQKQIADGIGVTYNAISQYESGAREPSIDLLIKLCKFLDVTSDYLIGLSD